MTWEVKKLGEVITENPKSKIQVRNALNEGKYVFFTSGEKTRFFDSHFCEGENIFIATGGKAVIKFYVGAAAYSTDTYSIKGKNSISVTKYIYYFILINMKQIEEKMFLGAAIKHLQKKDFKNLEISLPPLPEQKRIVAILNKTFESITQAKENAEKNLENANEIFESYLQSIFENKGEGWKEKRLGEVLKLEYGKPLDKGKRKPDGKYAVYGANGETHRSDEYYYNKRSIIVGRKGSAGEINFTEEKFWPLDVTYFVTFDNKKYDLDFIYHLLSKLKLPSLAKGVKPGINRNEVYSINVQIPSLPEQKSIVSKLDALSQETKKLEAIYEKKLADLEELKKSILQKAFNGELIEALA